MLHARSHYLFNTALTRASPRYRQGSPAVVTLEPRASSWRPSGKERRAVHEMLLRTFTKDQAVGDSVYAAAPLA